MPINQVPQTSERDSTRVVLHYLYFPKKASATKAASALREQGFMTDERLGADGKNWLVLARHQAVLLEASIEPARQAIEKVTLGCEGEYDGWEAEVES
jgi:Regulator of ribonuclease activity B